MLNEKKVQLMTRMAMYESKAGQEDFKINAYYKKDYTSYQTIFTIIWVTIGYAVIVGLGAFAFIDQLFEQMNMQFLIMLIVLVVLIYIALIIIYGVAASRFYRKKHEEARQRVKKFNHDLTRLNKMYEREKM